MNHTFQFQARDTKNIHSTYIRSCSNGQAAPPPSRSLLLLLLTDLLASRSHLAAELQEQAEELEAEEELCVTVTGQFYVILSVLCLSGSFHGCARLETLRTGDNAVFIRAVWVDEFLLGLLRSLLKHPDELLKPLVDHRAGLTGRRCWTFFQNVVCAVQAGLAGPGSDGDVCLFIVILAFRMKPPDLCPDAPAIPSTTVKQKNGVSSREKHGVNPGHR